MKLNYNIYLKNKSRKSATWTARIRQDGRVKDVNLHTQDRAVAERWLRMAKRALEEYTDAVAEGKATDELYGRVIKITDVAKQEASTGSPVTMAEAISKYEVELRRRNYRDKTIECYVRALNNMYGGCTGVDSASDVERVLGAWDGKSSGTRHYYASIMKGFLAFIRKRYGVSSDDESIPAVKVEAVKTQPHWEIWQMRKIIEHAKCLFKNGAVDEERTEWIKIYFWLLATSGLRQGEAYTLLWGDIDWDGCQICLRESETKARVARRAPMQQYVVELLARKFRAGEYASTDPIFVGKIPGQQSSRYQVLRRAIDDANSKLPVKKQIPRGSLHTFRHSVSMILYSPDENGVRPDIKTVAEILGHAEKVALKYYQSTRGAEEKNDLLNSKFSGSDMRSVMDDMIAEGLI